MVKAKEKKIFWTTGEQKKIPIKELSDKHLLNIFNYIFTDPKKLKLYKRLFRTGVVLIDASPSVFSNDFDNEASTLFDMVHRHYSIYMGKEDVFNAIIQEIAIRKLDTKINFNDIYNSQ